MEYEVIRSDRRTMAAEIKQNRLLIRVPRRTSDEQIRRFLQEHRAWIEKHLARAQARERLPKLTQEELRTLAKQARERIPARVAFFAPQVGVSYGRITIRSQRSRWGSCSANGNLSFNCLLLLAPPEVLDGVVVHELCHRKQMNHSKHFYAELLRVLPDYRARQKWLKENADLLMARLPDGGAPQEGETP